MSNGDPFSNGFLRPTLNSSSGFRASFPKMFMQGAGSSDLVLTSSMGESADYIAQKTSARISLLPLAAPQATRGRCPPRPHQRDYQVVFIGSNNRARNPLKPFHWYARDRERLVRGLASRFGAKFAVFGHGWEGIASWQGPAPFDQQVAICQRAEVVVGGVPFSRARYYMSNRPFIQIASGVPFVDLAVPGVGKILREGDHWFLSESIEGVIEYCDDILSRPIRQRDELAGAAAAYVAQGHTDEARLRSLVATLAGVHRERLGGPASRPDFRFFLPEVVIEQELAHATRGWKEPLPPEDGGPRNDA
jgi:hypothetical protein